MTPRRAAAVLVLVTLTAVLSGGCAVPVHEGAHLADEDAVPFQLLDEEAPPLVPDPGEAAGGEDVTLCFIRENRLLEVTRRLPTPVAPEQVAAALASPSVEESVRTRTVLSDAQLVREITVVAGVGRIDLGASIEDLGGDDQLLLVAQLVCTLTARPGIGQVSFQLEGAPVAVPRGDGSLVSAPVSRDDYRALLT